MKSAKCPTCGKPLSSTAEPSHLFCSLRCRQIDLSRWLDGDYAIPGRPLEEEELDEALRDAEDVDNEL